MTLNIFSWFSKNKYVLSICPDLLFPPCVHLQSPVGWWGGFFFSELTKKNMPSAVWSACFSMCGTLMVCPWMHEFSPSLLFLQKPMLLSSLTRMQISSFPQLSMAFSRCHIEESPLYLQITKKWRSLYIKCLSCWQTLGPIDYCLGRERYWPSLLSLSFWHSLQPSERNV